MTRTQVADLLDRFARGWKDLDGDQVTSCFVDSPATTVIGTDEGEFFVGWQAYSESWRTGRPSHVTEFGWEDSRSIEIAGDVAWAHGVIDFDITSIEARAVGRMWITCVAREVSSRWLIAHLHASFAGPVQSVE
ncbi:YybH family protein [Microbacterium forte]|uniref:YybH family protein n=1 Tax=Microbacterium forte TaxID=2982533 RepID=UPI002893479E|nr:nuclear transport factor 2 family protein [Microbacterium sp. A(2022)]